MLAVIISSSSNQKFLWNDKTIEGDSPVNKQWKDVDVSENSVYWILGMNVGGSNFQL